MPRWSCELWCVRGRSPLSSARESCSCSFFVLSASYLSSQRRLGVAGLVVDLEVPLVGVKGAVVEVEVPAAAVFVATNPFQSSWLETMVLAAAPPWKTMAERVRSRGWVDPGSWVWCVFWGVVWWGWGAVWLGWRAVLWGCGIVWGRRRERRSRLSVLGRSRSRHRHRPRRSLHHARLYDLEQEEYYFIEGFQLLST